MNIIYILITQTGSLKIPPPPCEYATDYMHLFIIH